MSMSSEDKIIELLQDAIDSQPEIAQNFNDNMSPSWLDQSIETTFGRNLNNSYNQDWRMHQDFSMSYDETNGFEKPTSSCQPMFKPFEKEKKEWLKVCENVLHNNRVVMGALYRGTLESWIAYKPCWDRPDGCSRTEELYPRGMNGGMRCTRIIQRGAQYGGTLSQVLGMKNRVW
ncbi:hypothetical protein LWI29_030604 [Acer saccharum]|uniref:Uncharacterized protein n=1 Tax=Acer saccharum TaxID=4024 RepID=A0AA39TFD7_ACESA|nr:hypothetical protein LWI29_030604 [Acer saccharum]